MKKGNKRKVLFVAGLIISSFGAVAYAINILSEGYRVLPAIATTIDTTPIGGDCKVVVTPNDGRDRFVPTKTLNEWNVFKSAAPGLGIALNSCAVNCVGAFVDNGTCSVTCGGGVLQQSYVISTPAQNGGNPCPYGTGATQWGGTSCNTQACVVSGHWVWGDMGGNSEPFCNGGHPPATGFGGVCSPVGATCRFVIARNTAYWRCQ